MISENRLSSAFCKNPPDGCPKPNPEDAVVVLLPNTDPWPKPALGCPKPGALLWEKSPVPVPVPVPAAEPVPVPAAKEKELALLALVAPNIPAPPPVAVDVVEVVAGDPNPELALNAA